MQCPSGFNKEETDDKFYSWVGGEHVHLFRIQVVACFMLSTYIMSR